MTKNIDQLPPNSAGPASVLSSHSTALQRAAVRVSESFLLLAVFAVVVGPVYAMTLWLVPQGLGSQLALYLLATMSYVAMVVAGIVLIDAEGRRESPKGRSRLTTRWSLVRAEVARTVLLSWVIFAGIDAVTYIGSSLVGIQLQGTPYSDDLVYYATGGAALMAWVSHMRGSVHLPQLMMICRDRPVAVLRETLITRAKRRYDAPVTFGLILPLVVAIAASQSMPLVSVFAWLHTAWYLHVTLTKAWLAKPVLPAA
ncbi:hypothetical protein [Salinisphaera sp. T31B1]|uniref:hypothetical protein n=1 Tax=Salinisphaera sp. T31B1 TaxID=727963 RepID=UPI0033416D29